MKLFSLKQVVLAASLGAAMMGAQAAPILLGSIAHLYGSDSGRQAASIMGVYHPGGSCDTVNSSSITVRATSASTCNRFADIFDFSGIDFASIDRFEVTLSFSGARDQTVGLERWNVRGASNYVQSAQNFGSQLNASGTQTFVLGSSSALFNDILLAQDFVLSFAQTGLGGSASAFTLNSASVQVFGTRADVPEPGSMALAGLALSALAIGRRRKR